MIWLNDKIEFPDYTITNDEGIIAFGGDLSEKRLIHAYKNGIFPWFSEKSPIMWFCPQKRMVLFPDEVNISKSMQKIIHKNQFEITENQDFKRVISNCKNIKRKDGFGTWITDDMEKAYNNLHSKGIAKSIEVWRFLEKPVLSKSRKALNDKERKRELVGGLYGLEINGIFCGESMFSKVSNASKLAFIYVAQQKNYRLIDCQIYNDHLASLGAREIDRDLFLAILKG